MVNLRDIMKEKLRQIHILKICLALILSLSIFPDVGLPSENTYNKVEVSSTSEVTDSCNEHHCPILPTKPFHHCTVCCSLPHYYVGNLSTEVAFHSNNPLQSYSLTEDALYKELLAKTIFHPPQVVL